MFSGIVEKQGTLVRKKREGKRLVFTFQKTLWDRPLKRGESISVNGVCLTAVQLPKKTQFKVETVPQTLAHTTLAGLIVRDKVNLERSLKWGERIGGHFVLGHVDGIGRIIKRKGRGKSFTLEIEVPLQVHQNLVPKGSIAVDGVSLTIQKLLSSSVEIAVIPYTAETSSLGRKKVGDRVNIEADVIAKHLARWIHRNRQELEGT